MSVEWEEDTLDKLADIYVEATPAEREAIGHCVERINAQLAIDPHDPGESRGPGRRVWFTPPLVVAYDLPAGGGVLVNHVAKSKDGPAAE
ncbi:MAG TPA: hypothetical protein VFG68_13235 [Fimbriiglobus sp.]|nr:hypothetical protein [Fimbriiglobus sp.]